MPLRDENADIVGIIGISVDITDKKKFEEELALKLDEKTQKLEQILERYESFVYNQEHDMITPYAGLLAASEELLDMTEEVQDPEARLFIEGIHKSAIALHEYQRSLLDAVYLFNDTNALYNRRFNVRELINNIVDSYLCSAQQKSIKLTLSLDGSVPTYLLGDWFRLQNCLMQLLSNAVKYTGEEGEIEVRCLSQPTDDKKKIMLDIQVEDNGIGIEKDKCDVIFEPFVRLTLSNIGKYEGRGVGLAYVKKMVDELQGEIDVNSIPGKGSVFQLLIPMELSVKQDDVPKPKGK